MPIASPNRLTFTLTDARPVDAIGVAGNLRVYQWFRTAPWMANDWIGRHNRDVQCYPLLAQRDPESAGITDPKSPSVDQGSERPQVVAQQGV